MTARAWLESEAWQVMADFGPPKAPELKKGSHLESILGHQGCQSWKGLKVSRINLGYQFLKSWKMRDPQFFHVILWIWWLCFSHHLVLFDFSNTGCISLAFLHCEPLMAEFEWQQIDGSGQLITAGTDYSTPPRFLLLSAWNALLLFVSSIVKVATGWWQCVCGDNFISGRSGAGAD